MNGWTIQPAQHRPRPLAHRLLLLIAAAFAACAATLTAPYARAQPAAPKAPNILIIWGDDIGWFNPSCYHGGTMGYQTPNIDRIAREGARFTDWYGQQSCT